MKVKKWQCQKCRNFVEPYRYCSICNAHFSEIKEVEVELEEYKKALERQEQQVQA